MHRREFLSSLAAVPALAAGEPARPLPSASDRRALKLGTVCEYQSRDAAVVRRNVEATKDWIKLARDVGSPSVKVRPNGMPKDIPEEKTLEQIGRALAECAAFADEHGVTLQLEVHGETTSRLPR